MFEVYKDQSGQWRWRLKAGNHQIIAGPEEGYRKRSEAKKAIERVRKVVATAAIVEVMADNPMLDARVEEAS